MNKDKLKLWIEALRSGEFKQANNFLALSSADEAGTMVTSYCCLGVACEVAIKDGLLISKDFVGDDHISYGGEAQQMPLGLMNWLGVEDVPSAFVEERLEQVSVIELNDECRWNFDQIADGLEAAYLMEEQ